MEIKKSPQADLESRRTQSFLLGIIVVLAALFVALEYTPNISDGELDADALDEIVKELDLEKLKEEEQRIPLITKPVALVPKTLEKLNIVEEEEAEELNDDDLMPDETDIEDKTTDEDEVRPDVNKEELDALDMKVVEQLPEFPGGATALMKWLTKNLRYPNTARQRKVQGRVVTQFIVNTDGTLSDLKVVESSTEPSLDREALRVLRMMPAWKAGQMDQKPCRTMVCIPIVFKL